ncbi:MAG: enoyl-CoA hydratase/isomerase family protein [Xanthomonadaceae bacterium]|nr:enoyl-CoA hydratase/isomerase family protein [Xanthomonadaceae bacterium]
MLEMIDHGAVREVHMNRPPVNALDPGLVAALDAAISGAASEARAVVLSGNPGLFSAGLDMKALLALDRAQLGEFWQSFQSLLRTLATSPIPVVAAITGHSPAGGAVMAIFCDERVGAEGEFVIGVNEVQVGLTMPALIHSAMVRLVGARQAERLCVGGLLVQMEEALRIGLVDELVPPDQVVARAVARCEALLKLPPKAMTNTRALCRADLAAEFDRVGASFADSMNERWFSDETQSTMKAVLAQLAAKKK